MTGWLRKRVRGWCRGTVPKAAACRAGTIWALVQVEAALLLTKVPVGDRREAPGFSSAPATAAIWEVKQRLEGLSLCLSLSLSLCLANKLIHFKKRKEPLNEEIGQSKSPSPPFPGLGEHRRGPSVGAGTAA